ncbi:3'-5' exonuclease [Streptomyces sp. NBC_00847]|uniref:3'-5' exonuclease n=1 Tax=Streptomyces sp. NBC_00847 TaxID=2975850 RepID=UPI00225E6F3B|nr:3'-5' exonuclease [Streptomyces sp. NBC_00847]MCX4885907.1 3'-5' exonuclease [Streptomyces sp. NBC_00847]
MADTTQDLPVYERGEVPAHLRTMTQLKADRLKPAEDQQPVGLLRMYRRGHGWGKFPLYDPARAAKMRPLSAKQQRAMTDRRTCPECSEVRDYIVYQRCGECRQRAQQEAQDRQARTCARCRREAGAALPRDVHGWPACDPCRIRYALCKQASDEREAVWRRTCPGHPGRACTVQTATDEEIAEARAAGTWRGSPLRCTPCDEAYERWYESQRHEAAENERRAEEDRRRQVAELSAWARQVLADPDTVILDTETTGLEDDARIVDLAVTTVAGTVLVDTLINPGEPIPWEATGIHGITDDQVATAPAFADVLPQLAAALEGKRCLIYNRPYDVARLRHELTLHRRQAGHPDPEAAATAWIDGMRFEDAMIPYSDWYGDWSDYWGNYAWQPLYGGDHRAVSDCRAVVERLREMAATADLEDSAA